MPIGGGIAEESYPSAGQTYGQSFEMPDDVTKPLTPLVEEIEQEEREEALQRLNEEYSSSKHDQIYRFLHDQEELNRRFAQFAIHSEEEEATSSDEADDVLNQKVSYYAARGRRLNVPRRSASFDSLEQNVPSDDDRADLQDLDEDIKMSAAQKKERKKRKKPLVKKSTRPQTAMGNREGGDYYQTSFCGGGEDSQKQPVYRTDTDAMPPAPRSSPNAEFGLLGEAKGGASTRGSLEEKYDSPRASARAPPTNPRYSSYGSSSRRPKSVVPATDHVDAISQSTRPSYGGHVVPASTLDDVTRQRLYAQAESIIERQNRNNGTGRQRSLCKGEERTFITKLKFDENAYRRLSKSACGVRKPAALADYKGNARPIKVLKLPPLDPSVINKGMPHGTGILPPARGAPGHTESLVG